MRTPSFIKNIIESGLYPEDKSTVLFKKIRISNALCLVISFVVFIYIFFFYALGFPVAAVGGVVIILGYILVISLNKKRKFYASRMFLSLWPCMVIVFYTSLLGSATQVHFILFGTVLLPLVILEYPKNKEIYFLIAIQLLSFFVCHNYLPSNPKFLSPEVLTVLGNGLLISSFAVLLLCVNYFVKSNHYNENMLLESLFQRLKIEKEQQLLINDINNKNKELESYAHVIAHDLRAPLNNVIVAMDLLKPDASNDPKKERDAQIMGMIKERTERMLDLINAVLEFSKLGVVEGEIEHLSTQELVQNLRSDLDFKECNFSYHLPLDYLKANPIAITRVSQNLLGNAIKYNDKGKNGEISLSISKEDDAYKIVVKDNGKGIPKDKIASIYNLFETAHGITNLESTGIGLAVVKKLVSNFSGTIQCESTEGFGCTFKISWPIPEVSSFNSNLEANYTEKRKFA